jgi:hypothetical protein
MLEAQAAQLGPAATLTLQDNLVMLESALTAFLQKSDFRVPAAQATMAQVARVGLIPPQAMETPRQTMGAAAAAASLIVIPTDPEALLPPVLLLCGNSIKEYQKV